MTELPPPIAAHAASSSTPPTLARRSLRLPAIAAVLLLLATVVGCAVFGGRGRDGTELRAAGGLFSTGTPVVLWTDPDGYDAYQTKKRFEADAVDDGERRYAPLRRDLPQALRDAAARSPVPLSELQKVVHLFVLHFDVCGTSRRCFQILHDKRNLSVHFLLDTDGTLYQTLDLQDTGWHATYANAASVGIEIAHPGTWKQPLNADMRRWYDKDDQGWKMLFPAFLGDTGLRTKDFVARPIRPELVSGRIHDVEYFQFDFTPQQYKALAHLCAALNRVFPRIRLEAPRDQDGKVLTTKLPNEQLLAFDGIVGHFHVQLDKNDPGPALQWDRLLREAKQLRGKD